MSAFRPYFPFLITSGVIQNGVPFTVCCCSVLLPVSEGIPGWSCQKRERLAAQD